MANESEHKVKVQFFGICTHMGSQKFGAASVHWGHRVVLVNARHPKDSHEPKLRHLNPHVGRLQIKAKDITGPLPATPWFPIVFNDGETIEWDLDGVHLRVGGERPHPGSNSGNCIPHLGDLCVQLPPAGPATHVADREKASCFFDFGEATFEGKLHGQGASMGVLTVGTTGSPKLHVKNFGLEAQEVAIDICPGAEVSVSNIPLDPKADKKNDFLLHFLAAEQFPLGAIIPPSGFLCTEPVETYNLPLHLGDITGPGCSNSSYP